MRKYIAFMLALVLALSLCACGRKAYTESTSYADGAVITIHEGEPTKTFTVEILDKEQNKTTVNVKTDLDTVGEVLQQAGLLGGEQGEYGLYIHSVNGIPVDYEKDQAYWAFYINGEYAVTGVDMTESEDGAVYTFAWESAWE